MRSGKTTARALWGAGAVMALGLGMLTACTSGGDGPADSSAPAADNAAASSTASGDTTSDKKIVIGFSGPANDHGWLGAINTGADKAAAQFPDVELKKAEGSSDANQQIAAVETFINDKVDAIVLQPTDGAALTDVAIKAMQAGIPVVNVDREFSSPFAARSTVLGDNYGMGVSAGTYICEKLGDKKDAIVGEIAGIDSLPLTQDRSKGFKDALSDCGLKVGPRVAADFTVAGGQEAASQMLSANPKIDAIWNHDDDQGVGVMAAVDSAGRNEFFMVGGAGSKNMMDLIKADDSPMKATVVYPSTQAGDGIALARLIVQGKTMGDLVTPSVPNRVVLDAPVVTKDNVDDFYGLAFES